MRPPYWHRLLDATSQLLNVAIFNGEPNHSISSDAHRMGRTWLKQRIDRALSWLEPNHCEASYLADIARFRASVKAHDDAQQAEQQAAEAVEMGRS